MNKDHSLLVGIVLFRSPVRCPSHFSEQHDLFIVSRSPPQTMIYIAHTCHGSLRLTFMECALTEAGTNPQLVSYLCMIVRQPMNQTILQLRHLATHMNW
jgi:hypothetical protein